MIHFALARIVRIIKPQHLLWRGVERG